MAYLKYCLILFSFLINTFNVFAQDVDNTKNTIYYELGGTGYALFSLNYERHLSLNEHVIFAPGIGVSLTKFLHVGGTNTINDYQLFIPLQTNFLFGTQNHYFETGFGMPIAIDDRKFGIVGSIFVLRFGYRYQAKESNLLFRASINPTWIAIIPFIMGGLSIGYAF